MNSMAKQHFINLCLLFLTVVLAFTLLNTIVVRTEALGGISLTEFLLDEFRIGFLKGGSGYLSCLEGESWIGGGTIELKRDCEADFYGFDVRIPQSTIQINSLGFRDREYQFKKGPNTYRIFVLGDSFTFGHGVDNDETYSERLENTLNSQGGETHFEVFNLGVPGTSTDHQYFRLLKYLNYSPDLIIVQSGGSDEFECITVREEIKRMLKDKNASESEKDAFALEYGRTLGWEKKCPCVRDYAQRIIKTADEIGIPIIHQVFDIGLGDDSCFKDLTGQNYYPVEAPEMSRRHVLGRVDPHPNRDGHRLIAEELFPTVIAAISDTRPEVLN